MAVTLSSLIMTALLAAYQKNTITTDYESAFLNGWQGVMPWTSNGVDANGDINDLAPATTYMLSKYREMIFPIPK